MAYKQSGHRSRTPEDFLLSLVDRVRGQRGQTLPEDTIFDEHGRVRGRLRMDVLVRERDRLQLQLDELELEIDTRSGYADPGLHGHRRAAVS